MRNFWLIVWEFGIIAAVSLAGETLNYFIDLPIPASVWGLVIMLLLLCSGILKADQVKDAGGFLVGIMSLMFVPATVKLITVWDEIKPILVPSLVLIFVTTLLVFGVAGKVTDLLLKKGGQS